MQDLSAKKMPWYIGVGVNRQVAGIYS